MLHGRINGASEACVMLRTADGPCRLWSLHFIVPSPGPCPTTEDRWPPKVDERHLKTLL